MDELQQKLLDGKKMRIKKWVDNEYIYFNENNMNIKDNDNRLMEDWSFRQLSMNMERWEEYIEPEKKISIEFTKSELMHICNQFDNDLSDEYAKVKKALEDSRWR